VTPWVVRLLVANIGMFLVQGAFPMIVGYLAFIPRLVLTQPWTLVTYMFLHGGFMHLLFNMIVIFFFGPRVESRLGSNRFIVLYLLAGITGALLSLVFTPRAAVIGASGGGFGIMLAFAMFWPREKVLIWGIVPVEVRLLVVITTILALFSGFSGAGRGTAHFAHLGGYLGAYLYLLWLDRTSGARRFRRKVTTAGPRVEKAVAGQWKNLKLDGVHDLTKEEVNRILDKISAQGLGSLTEQEKLFLSNFVPADDRKDWTQ
jgi:membrane associated rhomboid family serine protease